MRKLAFLVLACVLLPCLRVANAAENDQPMRTEPFEMYCKETRGGSERAYCIYSLGLGFPNAAENDLTRPSDSVEVFCSEASNPLEGQDCIYMKHTAPSCTGTIEERLNCLDDRLARTERENRRLKHELRQSKTPRVQPLISQLTQQ